MGFVLTESPGLALPSAPSRRGPSAAVPARGASPASQPPPQQTPTLGRHCPPRPCCKPSPWPCNCGTGWAPPAAPDSPRDSATPAWIRPQHSRGALGGLPSTGSQGAEQGAPDYSGDLADPREKAPRGCSGCNVPTSTPCRAVPHSSLGNP